MAGWNDVSFDERERLLRLYEARDKDALRREALLLEISPRTLARRCREHRLYKQKYAASEVSFPELDTQTFDDFDVIEGDDAVITSDFEEPYADPLVKELILLVGIKYNIKRLIINGDFLASDQPGISSHEPLQIEDKTATYMQSVRFGGRNIDAFLKWFDEVIHDRGNHDDMVNRATRGQIDLGFLLEGHVKEKGYRYTPYAYVQLETSEGPYLVAHPRQYRNVGLGLAQAIYNVWATADGRKAHIVLGHTHHTNSGASPDNLRGCYTLGCVRHLKKAAYKNLNITTHYEWNQGFGLLMNGYFHNFDVRRTDWMHWLGDLCPEPFWKRTKFPV